VKSRLLTLASLRFYGRHPWQLLLAVAGIALGIAVFVGIQLANDSARRAFEASSDAVRGQVTHRLLPVGSPIAVDVYRNLKQDRRTIASAPIIEAPVTLVLADGRRTDTVLQGIDPIEEIAVRGVAPGLMGGSTRLLTDPGAVLLPARLADRFALTAGDALDIDSPSGGRSRVVLAGTTDGGFGNDPVIADISSAQELTGMTGSLSRIDLSLDDATAIALERDPPPGTVLVSALGNDQTLLELTRAFNTNLSALGLLALVVGMFLIYSTISFTIVQRWRSIAVMRALGLNRRELLLMLLGEALAIGVVGTLLGLLLGQWLSAGLLELVLRTLDDLYFRRALARADSSQWIFLYSAALGIGATLLSALVPAMLASRREIGAENRGALERSAARWSRRFALAAAPTLALAALTLTVTGRALWPAFVALFLVLAAGAMLVPLATSALMRILEKPVAAIAGLSGRMAVRGVTDSLSRTGVATAALAVAVATVMSIGLMIASFRASLIEWIDTTVTADLYVDLAPESPAAAAAAPAAIEAVPGVTGLGLMRSARLATIDGQVNLRAASPGPDGYGIAVTQPAGASAADLLRDESSLLIAEPLAYRKGLAPGDTYALPTATGLHEFTITGVYRDYNTAGGELIIALDWYRRWFDDTTLTSVGVHLAPDADEDAVASAIRSALGGGSNARIRSTSAIQQISLLIFDRTFQVTEVLRLLAGIVAFLGILSAVMALELEREREFAVLRSLGMSVRELFTQILSQTSLLGLAAGIAAIPLGTALAWLLVYVINRRSFGWTMDFMLSPGPMLGGLAMALVAAVLAGIYPAFIGARADPGLAWRDD
jgi:putative ABC transport system permease protein